MTSMRLSIVLSCILSLLVAERAAAQTHHGTRPSHGGGQSHGGNGGRQSHGGKQIGSGTIEEAPAKTLRKRRGACERAIADARKYTSERKWGEARKRLDTAGRLAVGSSQLDTVRSAYQKLENEGSRQLVVATKLYEANQYAEALAEFERIARTFGALPSGKLARRAAKQVKKDPVAKAVFQETKAVVVEKLIERTMRTPSRRASPPAGQPASQPATMPGRVSLIKQLPADKQIRVVDLLERMARMYALSPTGLRAAADLKSLQGDENFSRKFAAIRFQYKAKSALRKAERFSQAGMKVRALQSYREVVRKFPDTDEAARAAGVISAIEESNR